MRNLRSFAVVALSVVPLMAYLAGCGGDDSSSGGSSGTPDSSTNTSSSGGSSGGSSGTATDSGPTAPTANATSVTLYIGSSAKLDGATSTGTGLTYAWTIKTAPAGSTITTASLATANAAATTFTPDKLGVYELELTVTQGTLTAKVTATATVLDPPVFYYENKEDPDAGKSTAQLLVTGATGGDGGKPVACFERDSGAYDTSTAATFSTDWWEAPAVQPSKAVFIMEATVDGGQVKTLFTTTSTGSCANAPTKLDFVAPPATGDSYERPRISPDGLRVAYARQTSDGARIATIGLDGNGLRNLGTRLVDNDGGPLPEAGLDGTLALRARPFWIGNAQVGWIESISDTEWQIARANDAANATREVIARCTGVPPYQATMLPSGEILVAQRFGNLIGGSTLLVVYPIVAATKTCGTARFLVPLPDGGSVGASDFMLSPDGKEVTYLASETGIVEMRALKVDGSSPPRKISNLVGATHGPRYVGAGSFVAFGNDGIDAGWDAGGVAVVPVDGGPATIAASGSGVVAIANCNMGNGIGSGVAFAGMAGVVVLRLLRRRRRD